MSFGTGRTSSTYKDVSYSNWSHLSALILLFSLNRMSWLRSRKVVFVFYIDRVSLNRFPQNSSLCADCCMPDGSSSSWSASESDKASESDTASSRCASASSISFSDSDSTFLFSVYDSGWVELLFGEYVGTAHAMKLYHVLGTKVGWINCHIIYGICSTRGWLQFSSAYRCKWWFHECLPDTAQLTEV